MRNGLFIFSATWNKNKFSGSGGFFFDLHACVAVCARSYCRNTRVYMLRSFGFTGRPSQLYNNSSARICIIRFVYFSSRSIIAGEHYIRRDHSCLRRIVINRPYALPTITPRVRSPNPPWSTLLFFFYLIYKYSVKRLFSYFFQNYTRIRKDLRHT